MQYREIVAVTGLSGLYQLMATKSDGAIVRSLQDNVTKFVPARLHHVTPLESIEVYTLGENVRLHEVFQKMKDSDVAKPEAKGSSADVKKYFSEVYPEMDADRVYDSDRKKMLKWFEILKTADLLDFSAMNEADKAGDVEDAGSEAGTAEGSAQVAEGEKKGGTEASLVEEGEEKPTKKAKAKKATEGDGTDEEKPAKKTAKKKSAEGEEGEEKPAKKTAKKKKEEE